MVLHYFKLTKLPATVAADNGLEVWLSLFRAKTEEELANLEALEIPGNERSEHGTGGRRATLRKC